ncbi:MAG: aldo/keto reductase [Melioribacteraceae bacterium]|nr:aldo/keto reductase [Melioribacteraceae bacterium]
MVTFAKTIRSSKSDHISKTNQMLDDFIPIAKEVGVSTLQLVLAWTLHQKGITHLLCGARNESQAKDNAKAGSVTLNNDLIKSINNIFNKYFG